MKNAVKEFSKLESVSVVNFGYFHCFTACDRGTLD